MSSNNTFKTSSSENVLEDEVVISGISGLFPSSKNIKEFEYNLYNKVNMVNDDESRWKHNNAEIPRFTGKIPMLSQFDSTFFGVHQVQADNMDPQIRLLLQESYKAVLDAGINPLSLRGSSTGVFIGACVSETENVLYYNPEVPAGFGLTGSSKAMFANRISYILGLTGPSLTCDTACSSSSYALDLAFHAMKQGDIDAAIVGGSNLCLHPNVSLQFASLGITSMNNHCRPFDNEAHGYTRSEAVCCVFLQKRSDAKRVYGTIVYSQTNCDGFKPEGITFPSSVIQEKLLNRVYSNSNVLAEDLGYLEAHSTGTVVGDPQECNAIDRAICSKRKKPLLVGSVKSNCGHAEPASGMCSLAKVIFTFQNNIIPPNINFTTIRRDIKALVNGRLKVVSEPVKLPKPFIGINSFGFGGANAHIILKQFEKEKLSDSAKRYTYPRLILWSGRTEESVQFFFSELEKESFNEEYLGLIQSSQNGGIPGMVYRGYCLAELSVKNEKPIILNKKVQHNGGMKKPLVWVFSGMGSQWVGMGKTLMNLPIFRNSIERVNCFLKPTGLDIINIITSDNPKTFDKIINSFVGIAAIQIAIVDILNEIGVIPDFLIGHSVGELGCAYADKCFTDEQTILAAYYRGKISMEIKKIKGSMAAVGLGFKDIKDILPETIEVACHNSSESCTVSGPSQDIENFILLLKSKNIFVKEVPCSNIAYHSKYISHFGPEFLKYLQLIIPTPKVRSKKWLSTSVPKSKWLENQTKYSSAEYHTNNLLSNVLFEETASYLPKNALTIEIAPHALLQSILKNALFDGNHIGLTKRNIDDSTLYLLDALGSLHNNGVELSIEKLYPKVVWPVSRGTPSISHLVEFDASREYFVYKFEDYEYGEGLAKFKVKLSGKQEYIKGHKIDGKIFIPGTFYLECVWKTFANLKGSGDINTIPVEFENVKFVRATTITETDTVELTVVIQKVSGKFEITEGHSLVVSGIVQDIQGKTLASRNHELSFEQSNDVHLEKKAFYKELRLKGYQYDGDFKAVEFARSNGSFGKILWKNNWVTFIDCMMQSTIVSKNSRNTMLPTGIQRLIINPQHHRSIITTMDLVEFHRDPIKQKICSGGIEMTGLCANIVQRRKFPHKPLLEKYEFIPHFPAPELSLQNIARSCLQLVQENKLKTKLTIVEIVTENSNTSFLKCMMKAVSDVPLLSSQIVIGHLTKHSEFEDIPEVEHISINVNSDLVFGDLTILCADFFKNPILSNLLTKNNTFSNDFLIIKENANIQEDDITTVQNFKSVAIFPGKSASFVLHYRSVSKTQTDEMSYVKISSSDLNFEWIAQVQKLVQKKKKITLIAQGEKINGIMGLINCLTKEPETKHLKCVFIDDDKAPTFESNLQFYENHLQKGLHLNVFRKGQWGTYRHLLLEEQILEVACSKCIYAKINRIGDFSSVTWMEDSIVKHDAYAKVVYSSLNFRDVMLASGRLPPEEDSREYHSNSMGIEFSGIEMNSGKPIMGMVEKSALASHIGRISPIIFEFPKEWTLEEAATVPVVYITVYYAFFVKTDITKGKTILIHAGSGGIGIAAIRTALAYGLEVLTTVSSAEKKSFLLKMFPDLKENHIGNSRNTSFEDMVLEQTNGAGVDFVLNSLSEEKLKASLRCLARGGQFLEIGKYDIVNNNNLELGVFLNEISYHSVFADYLFTTNANTVKKLKTLLYNDMENGIIQPLPSTVFSIQEVDQALKYLMSGKHIGKVLIQIHESPESKATVPIKVIPQLYFPSELVYIVVGGLGGFGLELVDWMVTRGAKKLILSSSKGICNDYQKYRINLWKTLGCSVEISTLDIGNRNGCLELISESLKRGDVGGIFNLAVVLEDGLFSNQSCETFKKSFTPKAYATFYLDEISRNLCHQLKFFVVFSSVSCGRGNCGQSNYGMSNSIMERIIENRILDGFPGKAIQWGAVGDVGLVAEMYEGKSDVAIGGTLQQPILSCLDLLDNLLLSKPAIVSSMIIEEKVSETSKTSPVDFVLNTLAINDIKSISTSSTLAELGLDSLMGTEIKQTLERDYDIYLSPHEIRCLTFNMLIELSETSKNKRNLTEKRDKNNIVHNLSLLYYFVGNNMLCPSIFDHVNDKVAGCPIIIFPGIDGCSGEIWKQIGKNVHVPAYVLQYHNIFQSMDELVDFAYQNVTKFLEAKALKIFKIMAYSFGTLIAHKVIELLENSNYHGSIIYIDGSPNWVENMVNTVKIENSMFDIEKIVVQTALKAIVPQMPFNTIKQDMSEKHFKRDWTIYIESILKKQNIENIPSILNYLDTILSKMMIIQDLDIFKSIGIIESPILLLKPTNTIFDYVEDYGLASLTTGMFTAETLQGNHQTILSHEELFNIINNFFQ